jgi:hypothetical protein
MSVLLINTPFFEPVQSQVNLQKARCSNGIQGVMSSSLTISSKPENVDFIRFSGFFHTQKLGKKSDLFGQKGHYSVTPVNFLII